MTMVAFSTVLSQEDVSNYLVSTFHLPKLESKHVKIEQIPFEIKKAVGGFVAKNQNPGIVNFEINYDVENAFIKPQDYKQIMEFNFVNPSEKFELQDLRLKIVGINPELIQEVKLALEDGSLYDAKIKDGYLEFENVDFAVEKNMTGKISIEVSVSDFTVVGTRLRFDIEKPADIKMTLGNSDYSINKFYPVHGPYLTVVRSK